MSAIVNKKRPVNLNLFTIQFPLPAITSILHRLSGFFIFLAIPLLLYLFNQSLISSESFDRLHQCLHHSLVKLVIWVVLAALLYHFVAGIKHLLMDFGIGESLEGGKRGAWITLIVSAFLILVAGVWLW